MSQGIQIAVTVTVDGRERTGYQIAGQTLGSWQDADGTVTLTLADANRVCVGSLYLKLPPEVLSEVAPDCSVETKESSNHATA